MNRYVILISDNYFTLTKKNFFQSKLNSSSFLQTSSLFEKLQNKHSKVFIFNICIGFETFSFEKNIISVNWKEIDADEICETTSIVSCLQASEIIFFLTDKLSYPGSFLLDIYWYISDSMVKFQKHLVPLLGCLKKLKTWQSAEITLATKLNSPSLPIISKISKFINANLVSISDKDLSTLPTWDRSVIWKGNLEICFPQSFEVTFGGFELLQHGCHCNFSRKSNKTMFQETESDNFWFGNAIKALELIDVNTVSLFWFSGSVFILKCKSNNLAGIKLKAILQNEQNWALLCRLKFLCTDEEFNPCTELNACSWKERIKDDPSDLNPPAFTLPSKKKFLHLILTTIPESCATKTLSNDFIYFHVYALHHRHSLNTNMLFEEELNSVYKKVDTTVDPDPSCITMNTFPNALKYQYYDNLFGKFFTSTLSDWIKNKSSIIDQKDLQKLILGCWSAFENKFRLSIFKNLKCDDSLIALKPQISYESLEGFSEINVLQLHENVNLLVQVNNASNSVSWFNPEVSKSNPAELNIDDILKKFSGVKYKAYVDELLQAQKRKKRLLPNSSDSFTSSSTKSYHGINFNIDAQGSEKKDYYCRKLVHKLIRFETYSIGSTTKVMSSNSAKFNDFPIKTKKVVHTPRKKKQLAKVAEKLYKKRNNISSSQTKCKATISKASRKVVVKPRKCGKPHGLQTPLKCRENICKDYLMTSPSTHKMTLRSSTPSKPSTSERNKTGNLTPNSKAAFKRQAQKQYVQDNKKRLQDIVVNVLSSKNIDKSNPSFSKYVKKLYQVSMAFLKDLKTSKDLESKMRRIVNENARLVLSLDLK